MPRYPARVMYKERLPDGRFRAWCGQLFSIYRQLVKHTSVCQQCQSGIEVARADRKDYSRIRKFEQEQRESLTEEE